MGVSYSQRRFARRTFLYLSTSALVSLVATACGGSSATPTAQTTTSSSSQASSAAATSAATSSSAASSDDIRCALHHQRDDQRGGGERGDIERSERHLLVLLLGRGADVLPGSANPGRPGQGRQTAGGRASACRKSQWSSSRSSRSAPTAATGAPPIPARRTRAWFSRTIGYESLVRWDVDWKNLVPDIAEKYEVSPDGKEFTWHLRQGMKWSDGQPFGADDFVFWFRTSS